jgi:hypothetical protein
VSAKFVRGKIAFDPEPLGALGIEYQDGGSPQRIEAMEPRRVFLDMGLDGQEIRLDELRGSVIRVGLGFQPGTSPSSRRRAEIQQHRAVGLPGLRQRGIHVLDPIDRHTSS